jgi:two-component system NtrC family sensor kinase
VNDNGPGIPAQYLDRIFDPFFTTKAVGKGTGLGLSICYGIIQKMGGTIEVESHMGQGTCFLIRLPLNIRNTTESSTNNNTPENL